MRAWTSTIVYICLFVFDKNISLFRFWVPILFGSILQSFLAKLLKEIGLAFRLICVFNLLRPFNIALTTYCFTKLILGPFTLNRFVNLANHLGISLLILNNALLILHLFLVHTMRTFFKRFFKVWMEAFNTVKRFLGRNLRSLIKILFLIYPTFIIKSRNQIGSLVVNHI